MAKEIIRKIPVVLAAGQDRIVKPKEASVITGRSLASMWRDELAGRFPPKLHLGPRSVGYRLSELQEWLDSREVVTKETKKPVALPGPGKKRGRPAQNAGNVETAAPPSKTEAPKVQRFKELMLKANLKPLEEIIPDCMAHVIEFEDDSSRIVMKGGYLLDLHYPIVGIFRCGKVNRRWAGKKIGALSEQEMSDFTKKYAVLKQKLKAAMDT